MDVRPGRPAVPRLLQQRAGRRPRPPPGGARRWRSSSGCWRTHSRYLHEAIVELAERLTATLPPALDTVLVVNSGSEANDLAWRIARAATGRSRRGGDALRLPRADRGHARPLPARSGPRASSPPTSTVPAPDGYRGPYRREEDGWAQRYAARIDDAAAALGGHGFAAIYVDPAFTADGILVPPPAYLAEAARRARALGGVLVADEVQAGHGRYGTGLWSFQPSGIEPDMVVMGKPMGNGFPVAALVVRSADAGDRFPRRSSCSARSAATRSPARPRSRSSTSSRTRAWWRTRAETGAYLRRGLGSWPGATRSSGTSGARACCSASSWSVRSACPRRRRAAPGDRGDARPRGTDRHDRPGRERAEDPAAARLRSASTPTCCCRPSTRPSHRRPCDRRPRARRDQDLRPDGVADCASARSGACCSRTGWHSREEAP